MQFPLFSPDDKKGNASPSPAKPATPPASIPTPAGPAVVAATASAIVEDADEDPEVEARMPEPVNLGAAINPDVITSKAAKLNLAPELERLVPFEVRGFQLDPGSRIYDRKQGDAIVGKSMRLANIVLRIKGTPDEAPYYFLANVTRITSNGTAKPRVTISLPSNQKGGGAYASGVLKCGTPAGRAAQEAWKKAVLLGPFASWVKTQDMAAFVKNTDAVTNQGEEMEIPGLTI